MVGVLAAVLATLGLAAAAKYKTLNLPIGAVCKTEKGVQWTCVPYDSCPIAKAQVTAKNIPDICSYKKELVVCCKPSLAKKMCEKYSEGVVTQEEDPIEGGIVTMDTCAAVEALAAGGKDAEAREFPHQALVGVKDGGKFTWVCGGSLISERFVLSAAHCSKYENKDVTHVRLGEYNKDSDEDTVKGYAKPADYEIIQIINHPNYHAVRNNENDISLYKLNRNVEFNTFIRPICLQTEYKLSKSSVIATGFGLLKTGGAFASILQKVNLTVGSKQYCTNIFGSTNTKFIDESMICANDPNTNALKSTCKGDSGGPLQVRLETPHCMYSQYGLVSVGETCREGVTGRKPGVYTRVSHFVPWIETIVWS